MFCLTALDAIMIIDNKVKALAKKRHEQLMFSHDIGGI